MKQVQRLSPLQLQTIELLGLTQLELEERVKQEIIDNPALEEGPEPSDDAERDDYSLDETAEKPESATADSDDYGVDDYEYNPSEKPVDPVGSYTAAGVSFAENLLQELMMLDFPNDNLRRLAVFMLGSLDDNGYLSRDENRILADFMVDTGIELQSGDYLTALTMLQSLDPPGVGARDLAECLRLQIERKLDENGENELLLDALDLVENRTWFAYFTQRQTDALLKLSGWDAERLQGVTDLIRHLIAVIAGAFCKFGIQYLLIVKWIAPAFLPAKAQAVMAVNFGIIQFFTACIGGFLACLICPLVSKGLKSGS